MQQAAQPRPRLDEADPAARLSDELRSRFGGDALTAAMSMERYMDAHGFCDRARLYGAAAMILQTQTCDP